MPDMVTYAMSKPKVIDLDKYWIQSGGATLGQAFLMLANAGGGTFTLTNDDEPYKDFGTLANFWTDVSSKRELRIELASPNFRVSVDQCARFWGTDGNRAWMLCFAFLIADGTSTVLSGSYAIAKINDNDAVVTVRVEPLTIPTTPST